MVGPSGVLWGGVDFSLLAAGVEKAIANENAATLNVMTLGGQVTADLQGQTRAGGEVPAAREG
ncbi:hypothetical protein ACFWPY_40410 [Streptomyces sp. NPDC058527]|uniref:hypothetical protein n=1 Tax=Streptomyces sp. NPDC058527 TaxID=3346539 RepID=UPI003660BB12